MKVIGIILGYYVDIFLLYLELFHNPPTETKIAALPLSQDVFFFLERTMYGVSHRSVVLMRSVEADEAAETKSQGGQQRMRGGSVNAVNPDVFYSLLHSFPIAHLLFCIAR